MATEDERGNLILSTGRLFKIGGAGPGTLGIDKDLAVTEGFDHDNDIWAGIDWDDDFVPITIDERIEICDAMIDRSQAPARMDDQKLC